MMPVPDFQSLMLPTLQVVAEDEITMSEAREHVATMLALTPDDLAELLPSGRQTTFANRIAWAKTFMERAGLVLPVRRGVFRITDRGRQVLAENPKRIDLTFLRRFPEYRAWRERSQGATEPPTVAEESTAVVAETGTPTDRIEAAYKGLMTTLREDLLTRMVEMSWQKFEELVVDLLVAMGYGGGRAEMARAFTRSGDEGLDGVVKEDALGLDVVYVQAKRWARDRSVGRPEIQAFVGSLEGARANKGVFVTTAVFSQPAIEFVERVSKRIVLINGNDLARHLVERGVAVRVVNTYEVKQVDEDYFID